MMFRGMFEVVEFSIIGSVTLKKDVQLDNEFHEKLMHFMAETDILCSEVVIQGQKYVNGDLLVLSMEDCDKMRVGLVKSIVVQDDKVYFMCRTYSCQRSWLQYFESSKCEEYYAFVEYSSLKDYKPLIRRCTSERFLFMLHHRISFMYT